MQGPPVNLVLLGLLVLFFGLQLRGRRQQPYSGWILGWILVFVSSAVWEVMPALPVWHVALEIIRVDLLTLGVASFLLSFLLPPFRAASSQRWAGIVVGPLLVLVDLQLVQPSHSWIYQAFTVAGGVLALFVAHRIVPRSWTRRRAVLDGLCVLTVVALVFAIRVDPARFVQESVLTPMLVGSAVLYMASSRSRRTVRALGGLGFLLWAEFYIFGEALRQPSFALNVLYQMWDVPKYCVGVAMVLELFETARISVERLADRYRVLYENLNVLYETHPQPMWVYEAGTQKMLSANATAIKVYGYGLEEWMHMPADALELPLELEAEHSMTPWPVGTAPLISDSRRALHRHKDGSVVTVLVVERSLLFAGKDARVVLAVDITRQEKLHRELFHRAHHDVLTQLPNRDLLEDRVDQALARSERDGRCAVLLTIDIDHFKNVNDTHGHPVGDECLKLVAARLQSRIRQVDTLARTGGEEFTAIIGGLSRREDAETVAESLRRLFDAPLVLGELILPVTVSIGAALYPDDGANFATLRKRSDDALYQAKRSGRNRSLFHAKELAQAEAEALI